MKENFITIREIIRETFVILDDQLNEMSYDEQAEICVQKIKQKLAHMKRVLFNEIVKNQILQPHESIEGSKGLTLLKPLSAQDIIDIVYTELDHCIEGLDEEKKNLKDMVKPQEADVDDIKIP